MEDGVSGDLYLLYQGSRDLWKGEYFHGKCDNKGATIAVIWSSDGFIFGGFLINHGHPLEDIASPTKISCSPQRVHQMKFNHQKYV